MWLQLGSSHSRSIPYEVDHLVHYNLSTGTRISSVRQGDGDKVQSVQVYRYLSDVVWRATVGGVQVRQRMVATSATAAVAPVSMPHCRTRILNPPMQQLVSVPC